MVNAWMVNMVDDNYILILQLFNDALSENILQFII